MKERKTSPLPRRYLLHSRCHRCHRGRGAAASSSSGESPYRGYFFLRSLPRDNANASSPRNAPGTTNKPPSCRLPRYPRRP